MSQESRVIGVDHALRKEIANHIRGLSLDMVMRANSGHPGLPLGCADLFAWLYSCQMKIAPLNPHWEGRDYFVLSAGHGSAALYSTLFVNGYDYQIGDLQAFRSLHSKTPGHPEYGLCPGVEATTGPLGQGFANAVGIALGLHMAKARYGDLFDQKVYCLVGDGCLMEGISHEAASMAGHLGLDKLVLFYDANRVTLDANFEDSCSDDVHLRFAGYGWDVVHIDGLDLASFDRLQKDYLEIARHKPLLVVMRTVIGYGLPEQGTHKVHGEPPKPEDAAIAKKFFGIPEAPFSVTPRICAYQKEQQKKGEIFVAEWNAKKAQLQKDQPEKASLLALSEQAAISDQIKAQIKAIEAPKEPFALRNGSAAILQNIAQWVPHLVGSSADLGGSDKTPIKAAKAVTASDFSGRNIKYGIREFAMAAGMAGVGLTGLFIPYCGTFFTFSDYMRNAVRLAALSHYRMIYIWTHDSIFVGEDGPTHEPVEHLASLRAMPQFYLFRPGTFEEAKAAWIFALTHHVAAGFVLTRQNVDLIEETKKIALEEGPLKGGYILSGEDKSRAIDDTLFATGSELGIAMAVAQKLREKGRNVRVVSLLCWRLFLEQDEAYIQSVTGGNLGRRISIEAASTLGWERFVGREGIMIGIDRFGASAHYRELVKEYGFSVDAIMARLGSC